MKWYPWLHTHFKRLITSYQRGRGHHALLIQALRGMGDKVLIYAIARFLMCHRPIGIKSCCECHSCQLMQSGTHPDYYTLVAEKGKTVGIDAVREVSENLYKKPQISDAKVVLLNNAASLTEAAAGALLKILEEPPEKTWFFLSCRESGFLKPTLRSRCLLYYMSVPNESIALSWIKSEITTLQSKEIILTALRLSSGAPIAALELLDPIVCAQRKCLYTSIRAAFDSNDWMPLLGLLNHNQVSRSLYWLISLFLDAFKIQQNITLINNIDNKTLAVTLANCVTNTALQAIIREICNCRQILSITGRNINRELLLTNQLMQIEHYLQSSTITPVFRF